MIMKKRIYIQPKMDTMVLPKDALMDPIALAGSGEGTANPAPSRASVPDSPHL